MIKKTLVSTIVLAIAFSSTAQAQNRDKEIFLSGISNTLKVIKYNSNIALKSEFQSKYCLYFNPQSGKRNIDEFDAVRLEALSLAQNEKPFYFKDKYDLTHLCFTTANNKEAIEKSKKYLSEKFLKTFSLYNPKIVEMSRFDKPTPLVQAIGVLHKDQSAVIDTLTEKITKLTKQNKAMITKMQQLKNMADDITNTLNNITANVNQNISSIAIPEDNYTQEVQHKAKSKPKQKVKSSATTNKKPTKKTTKPFDVDNS